jgi:hypothetical protein
MRDNSDQVPRALREIHDRVPMILKPADIPQENRRLPLPSPRKVTNRPAKRGYGTSRTMTRSWVSRLRPIEISQTFADRAERASQKGSDDL